MYSKRVTSYSNLSPKLKADLTSVEGLNFFGLSIITSRSVHQSNHGGKNIWRYLNAVELRCSLLKTQISGWRVCSKQMLKPSSDTKSVFIVRDLPLCLKSVINCCYSPTQIWLVLLGEFQRTASHISETETDWTSFCSNRFSEASWRQVQFFSCCCSPYRAPLRPPAFMETASASCLRTRTRMGRIRYTMFFYHYHL